VSSGHSEVAVKFCYLAMNALARDLRNSHHAEDFYSIKDDEGHVTYGFTSRDYSSIMTSSGLESA